MPTPWRYRGEPAVAYSLFSSGLRRSSDRDREVYEQGSPRENVCLRMPYSCAVNQVDSSMFGVVDSRSPNDCPHKACKGVVVEYQTEQYTEGGCVVLHTQAVAESAPPCDFKNCCASRVMTSDFGVSACILNCTPHPRSYNGMRYRSTSS